MLHVSFSKLTTGSFKYLLARHNRLGMFYGQYDAEAAYVLQQYQYSVFL